MAGSTAGRSSEARSAPRVCWCTGWQNNGRCWRQADELQAAQLEEGLRGRDCSMLAMWWLLTTALESA
eukprot:6484871-Amphidinium_carterae.2